MKNSKDVIEYNQNPKPVFDALDKMWVERGTIADWNELHALHYKDTTAPVGSIFWRCVTDDGALAGITLISNCSLMLGARFRVFPKLKPGGDSHMTNVARGKWMSGNLRRVSRVVTDTLYRGGGVGYRMLNLSMRLSGIRFIEIQSSMSKYNPFDQKAGFRHAHLQSGNAYEAGLKLFRKLFVSHPADYVALMQEFHAMPQEMQTVIETELRDNLYRWSPREKTGGAVGRGTARTGSMPLSWVVKQLQQLVFATPAYGVYQNPDCGRKDMPQRLPLVAFDCQTVNQPLIVDPSWR